MLEKAHAPVRSALSALCSSMTASSFRAVAVRGVPETCCRVADASRSDPPARNTRCGRLLGGERIVHVADLVRTLRLAARRPAQPSAGRSRVRAPCCSCRCARTMRCSAVITDLSPGSPAVHRQADRAVAELRRAGGHRDGERAADHRDARGPGAADRDRRGAGGHQLLARRPRAGVRRDARKGDAAVRGSVRHPAGPTTASAFMPAPCTACREFRRIRAAA